MEILRLYSRKMIMKYELLNLVAVKSANTESVLKIKQMGQQYLFEPVMRKPNCNFENNEVTRCHIRAF